MAEEFEQYKHDSQGFIEFVNNSVTSFHAVETVKKTLVANGFKQISEKDKWDIKPKGKYFFTRNQSTIAAFVVGGKYHAGNGFNLIGAHTDSPHLEVKPKMAIEKEGYVQVAVQPYGGGLWTTWFDRDLGLAGRVIVKTETGFESKLVRIDRPILRIPNLAIHLNREAGEKMEINKQNHVLPVLATSIKSQLEEKDKNNSQAIIMKVIASELNCKVEDIKDFELSLYDIQRACIGGINNEFIFSARLDNLMMSYCSTKALLDFAADEKAVEEESNVNVVVLFDNEEVGSETAHGAASPLVNEIVRRITSSADLFEIAIRRSFLISADMAHAVHPNYSDKHDSGHKPYIHKGPVLKFNANQRYASVAGTSFIVRELAARNNIPIQEFVVRNDSLCGSTIGNIVASGSGIRTVDIGNPQLSMHSIREMCGTSDVTHAIHLMKVFFTQFTALDHSLKLD